jgi:AcrR family transcriptional regulator
MMNARVSSASRSGRVEARRRQILDAAYRVFAAKGYQAASIADIAEKLGIGHGTFYRYFENKLDIFTHVVRGVAVRIGALVAAEDPEATTTLAEYEAQILRLGEALLAAFTRDPDLGRLLFYEALGVDDEIDAQIRDALDLFGGFTRRYLDNGVRRGFLRRDLDTETSAFAINAMIFEGARRCLRAPDPDASAGRWIAAVRELMLRGMAASG